jgi:hypothetical protein
MRFNVWSSPMSRDWEPCLFGELVVAQRFICGTHLMERLLLAQSCPSQECPLLSCEIWKIYARIYAFRFESQHHRDNRLVPRSDARNLVRSWQARESHAVKKLLAACIEASITAGGNACSLVPAARELQSVVTATNPIRSCWTSFSSNGYRWFKVAEVDYDNFIGAPLVELIRSVYERSVLSDLIRGWLPVRARKTCQ